MKGGPLLNNHYIRRFIKGWGIFIQNPVGKTGVLILGVFMVMALASFCLPLLDPMYDPMTGIDPDIKLSTPQHHPLAGYGQCGAGYICPAS